MLVGVTTELSVTLSGAIWAIAQSLRNKVIAPPIANQLAIPNRVSPNAPLVVINEFAQQKQLWL